MILSRFKKNKTFICVFLMACYTGMRTGEVFALTWDDIDFENRIINVNKTVYAKDKSQDGRWNLGATKTIGSSRKVYICDTLYKILLKYKKLQDDYKKKYGKNYKKYNLKEVKNKYGKLVEYKIVESNSKYNKIHMVFTRKDGTYVGTDIVRYPFKIIHYELGINCRFYNLTGSFATTSLRNGCEIKDIAEVLGHKRIETTENFLDNNQRIKLKEILMVNQNNVKNSHRKYIT